MLDLSAFTGQAGGGRRGDNMRLFFGGISVVPVLVGEGGGVEEVAVVAPLGEVLVHVGGEGGVVGGF